MKNLLTKLEWIWDVHFAYYLYNQNKLDEYYNSMNKKWEYNNITKKWNKRIK
jgi:hypothetical protein